MTSYIPITLVGNTLGERHRYLNSLVDDAFQKKIPFKSIQDIPELSAVDRLFKIDLASKLRHVEYIISNLKDDDMLYVSRALQSRWLLEALYHDIMKPSYLDNVLYPEMTTIAVNKMNNWLHVNLKDPSRCLEFFQYYSENNFDLALKFLWNCPEDDIVKSISRAFDKITPKRLKLLTEKCPRAVHMFYYEYMAKKKRKDLTNTDWDDENKYYCSLTKLINTDADLLLDIAEKYYNPQRCTYFSSRITRTIITKHKARYVKKPELYAAWLLHMPTLARCLNNDEIKDIVLRLARAEYLEVNYFTYKSVEPLIKQLPRDERESFKKMVFVDKSVGDKVKDWPYHPPGSPYSDKSYEEDIFKENRYENSYYDPDDDADEDGVMKKCALRYACKYVKNKFIHHSQTLLNQLFDKYRFMEFKETFTDLSKQIPAASSVRTREYMMLVLISKTGGVVDYLRDLLNLLVLKHNNEAENLRATIVRSLVKRANVWRLPDDLWQLLLKFARGLGLDGEHSDERCHEGVHAVMLRSILMDEESCPKVFSVFINKFTTFDEYNLNEDEKRKVAYKLPSMLITSAKKQTDTNEAVVRLLAAMKIINHFRFLIPGETYQKRLAEFVPIVSMLAQKDIEACQSLLRLLYETGMVRKYLFRENFSIMQGNNAYLNALRHDAQMLTKTDKFELLLRKNIEHDQFLRKIAIYFAEKQGLSERYLALIENEMAKNPYNELVRSYTILAGASLSRKLQDVDKDKEKTVEQKRLAVALRSYGHLARPKLDLTALEWRVAGVKAVANQISVCSARRVTDHVKVLSKWSRAPRLAYLLAERINKEVEVLATIADARPTVAIKITLRHLKKRRESYNQEIWKIGKTALEQRDLSHPKYRHLRAKLSEIDKYPESLRAEYGAVVYRVLQKVSPNEGIEILMSLEDYISTVDDKFTSDIIQPFLHDFTYENIQKFEYQENARSYLYLRIIAKYLLLCKSEEIQKEIMETVLKPFLNRMKSLLEKKEDMPINRKYLNYWNNFMFNLKCTEVFLDTSYISPLPVMQHIVNWLKETISIVERVDIFISMHIIMLYFKAVRQSISQNPVIFSTEDKRNENGIEIIGTIFGKSLAHEIIQLKTEYFESIVDIYAKVLINYLSHGFACYKSTCMFVSALIRGMLVEKDSTALLLAWKIYQGLAYLIRDLKDDTKSILEGIDDNQVQFFLKADFQKILAESFVA